MKELKEFMSNCADVDEWNERREEAIEKFGFKLFTELEVSGFIKESLNK